MATELSATSTVEDYLKHILVYQQSNPGSPVPTAAIANALDLKASSVSSMLRRLARDRLIHYRPYHGARLTEKGERLASQVLRRQRLIELFLVKVVGIPSDEVHPEAELLEHAVSDRLVERMAEMLGHPQRDPHGALSPCHSFPDAVSVDKRRLR